jgi:murein L,D-transpeptidase YafK
VTSDPVPPTLQTEEPKQAPPAPNQKAVFLGVIGCLLASVTFLIVQLTRRAHSPAPPPPTATTAPPVITEPEPAPIVVQADTPAPEPEQEEPKPAREFRRSDVIQFADVQGDRPQAARARVEKTLRDLFAAAGLQYPPERLFLRAFKHEREMELWSAPELGGFRLVATYEIAGYSGGPGPKRREGDGQTPEGFYQIDRFNPKSNFHVSMGLNYPNASDQVLSDSQKPGHDIFIHGRASSIGCLAMGDDRIEELFIAAADTIHRPIQVHIFPMRMNSPDWPAWRDEQAAGKPELLAFWDNLVDGFEYFEHRRVLPRVTVQPNGRYEISAPGISSAQDLRQ